MDDSGNNDRDEFRRLGYLLVDQVNEWFAEEVSDPVLATTSAGELQERFHEELPKVGEDPELVLRQMFELLDGATRKNGHPGFLGYVSSSAHPVGVLADFWTSAVNQNVTAWRSAPGATSLELHVVGWLSELVGFGSPHGLLTSGGSMANSISLACALEHAARRVGRERADCLGDLCIYVSEEAHLSIAKAFALLGGKRANLRTIRTDSRRRMSLEDLVHQWTRDREHESLIPACVIASAGTVNTGALDPILELSALCRDAAVWLHVDGAYGAPVACCEEFGELREGLSQVDSLSIDPHKWLFCPIDVGCALIRHRDVSESAFRFDSAYTTDPEQESPERFAFFEHGWEMTRRQRALKVWAVIKTMGQAGLAEAIQAQIDLRRGFDELVKKEARLELLGSGMSISCFRVASYSNDAANELNRGILERLNREGRYFLSPTTLEGRFTLRICIVNLQTAMEHLEQLIADVLRIASELENH